jgi:hypothetical protein
MAVVARSAELSTASQPRFRESARSNGGAARRVHLRTLAESFLRQDAIGLFQPASHSVRDPTYCRTLWSRCSAFSRTCSGLDLGVDGRRREADRAPTRRGDSWVGGRGVAGARRPTPSAACQKLSYTSDSEPGYRTAFCSDPARSRGAVGRSPDLREGSPALGASCGRRPGAVASCSAGAAATGGSRAICAPGRDAIWDASSERAGRSRSSSSHDWRNDRAPWGSRGQFVGAHHASTRPYGLPDLGTEPAATLRCPDR